MKKVILVQPKVGSWEFIQDVPMLPLALLQISSYLINEYDIKIIDQRLEPHWVSLLKSELKGDVVCVGITTMTGPQILYALEASKIVKENSKSPVVWGGIHPSILPEQTVSHPFVDIVVAGEGEIAFRDLVYSLDKGKEYDSIPGIWTKKDSCLTGSAPEVITDINSLPPIPYNLIHVEKYISFDRDGRKKFPIQTSRGCPYRCIFCHQTAHYRKKWRALNATRVSEEIRMLVNQFGIKHFQILDDNFFVDQKRAHSIIEKIAENNTDVVFTINGARATDILRMRDETLSLLGGGRCRELQIGLESGSQRVLNHMKKDTTLAQIYEANHRLRNYHIPRYYELVSGFKEETIEDLEKTAQVILDLSKDDRNVFFAPLECLTPYPGTEVYEQAKAQGMAFPESIEEWSEYEWHKTQLPWLDDKKKQLLESIHLFPTFISYRLKTVRSPLLELLFRIYRPVARFRIRNLFFNFPFETLLFNIVSRLRS